MSTRRRRLPKRVLIPLLATLVTSLAIAAVVFSMQANAGSIGVGPMFHSFASSATNTVCAPITINGVNVGCPTNYAHRWGNCRVIDFAGGPYGKLIVSYGYYTSTAYINTQPQIVRTGMLGGWFDQGGAPGKLGCPLTGEKPYLRGVKQDFQGGSLYWVSGMNHARPMGSTIQVFAPLKGTWPTSSGCPAPFPSDTCSLPQYHHEYTGVGGWATDIQNVGYSATYKPPVYLYASHVDSALRISAKVETIGPACASRALADGGYRVTIDLLIGTSIIGKVTYMHVEPTAAIKSAAQTHVAINPWGTQIGTVGKYRYNKCWKGVHLHVELWSPQPPHNYACYNVAWKPGQALSAKSSILGLIGDTRASNPRQGCP